MKKIILVMSVLTAMLCADINVAPVAAEKEKIGIYVGASYTYVDADLSQDISFDGGIGSKGDGSIIVGYNVTPYLAVEGRVSETSWSVFAKPQYGFGNGVMVYGLLGAGQVKLTSTYTETKTKDDEDDRRIILKLRNTEQVSYTKVSYTKTDFQYGIGAAYNINRNFMVFVDYTKPDTDIDMINVGVVYKF